MSIRWEIKVLAGQLGQTRFFQRRIVVGVEVVDAEHLVTAVEETPRNVVADEAGRAADEDHWLISPPPAALTSLRSRAISLVSCSYSSSFRRRNADVTSIFSSIPFAVRRYR